MIVGRREAWTGRAFLVLLMLVTIVPFVSLFVTALHAGWVLPEDRDATDRAWRDCVGLSQAAPRSALRAGLVALTRQLVPVVAAASPAGSSAIPPSVAPGASDPTAVDAAVGGMTARRRRGRHAGFDPG